MAQARDPTPAQSHNPTDRHIRAIQQRIKDQEALVLRMIVQGSPTQSAEDQLRQLTTALRQMQEHRDERP
jgi:hypothetical protein